MVHVTLQALKLHHVFTNQIGKENDMNKKTVVNHHDRPYQHLLQKQQVISSEIMSGNRLTVKKGSGL